MKKDLTVTRIPIQNQMVAWIGPRQIMKCLLFITQLSISQAVKKDLMHHS